MTIVSQKFTQDFFPPMKNVIFQNTRFLIKKNKYLDFSTFKRFAMSVYIFLILSENATLDAIVFHCEFCILKWTSQSSNGTIEVIKILFF